MKNINVKIIKFRKQDDKKYPPQNLVGFVPESYQKNKPSKISQPHVSTTHPNKITTPNPDPPAHQDLAQLSQKVDSIQPQSNSKNFQSDFPVSDNDEFVLSSIKKKPPQMKISKPKYFEEFNVVSDLKGSLLNLIKRTQPVFSIEQMFTLPTMQNIMGIIPEEKRTLHQQIDVLNDQKPQPQLARYQDSTKNHQHQLKINREKKMDLQILQEEGDQSGILGPNYQMISHYDFLRPKVIKTKNKTQENLSQFRGQFQFNRAEIYDSCLQDYSSSDDGQNFQEINLFGNTFKSYPAPQIKNEFPNFRNTVSQDESLEHQKYSQRMVDNFLGNRQLTFNGSLPNQNYLGLEFFSCRQASQNLVPEDIRNQYNVQHQIADFRENFLNSFNHLGKASQNFVRENSNSFSDFHRMGPPIMMEKQERNQNRMIKNNKSKNYQNRK